ncbi:MAG: TRAP transporter large permease [Deltaproteobacteria bacterium]|nr:TRAP transporter large permease [Deltaproteobacteria bacterium]
MLFTLTFILCLAIGVPIFACLGIPPTMDLLRSPMPLVALAQSLYTGVDQFPLLAIPCFILAGAIMSRGGITADIIDVMSLAVGRVPGGMAVVTILSCMFFAAISGSGPGTVAAIGTIMIPAMKDRGYHPDFAAAVASSGGTLGILIPPSNPMIIYGVLASVSIAELFIAGILPGLLIGSSLLMVSSIISFRKGYKGQGEPFKFQKFVNALYRGKFSLFTPFLVLGGIYLGVFTPVEASVIAVIYAFFVSLFIKRAIGLREIWEALSEASTICGGLVLIMGTAIFFGRFLALNQVPQNIAAFMISISDNALVVLLIITTFLIFLGMFMETLSTVIILTPILLPLMKKLGVDPIHFGIIFVVTNEVGFLTPPLGVNLFVACSLTNRSIEQISRKVIPFIIVIIICMLILIYFPKISLLLPQLMR